ncbi:MAG TPA: toxin-antitoxin system YwqK family antitoxin [Candidatus Binataceae bacterium]|nr:toxin-antitoxin system YwqK family antitoxin [Candidatus Binataceae bacterium]
MKLKVALLILVVTGAAACRRAGSCPYGAEPRGERPPNGSETYCAKVVDGHEVKEGPFVLYNPDGGKMIEGNYHDGKQDGEWTLWYATGQKQSVDHYVNGVQDGDHTGWYSNGKMSAQGQYKDGKREGVWKRWDPNGFKNWEETYKNDQKIS